MNTNTAIKYIMAKFDGLNGQQQKELLTKMLNKAKKGSETHAALTDLLTNDFNESGDYMISMLEQCCNWGEYKPNEYYHHTVIRSFADILESITNEIKPTVLRPTIKDLTVMKRKSISKVVRLLLNNEITMNKARFLTGLKKSQLKQLVNARIVNNSHKPPFTIYQCLVTTRDLNVDISKVTKNFDGRLCVDVFGRPTPLFNY